MANHELKEGMDMLIYGVRCKYCDSENIIKYGKYGDTQLYYCKDCGSKFKADDTLFHMKTPANQVSSALNMYYEGMSIAGIRRNLQQEYGNEPSTATIYEWIQKFTQYAVDSIKDNKPKKIGNVWVADETVIEIWAKCLAMGHHRHRDTLSFGYPHIQKQGYARCSGVI